MILNKVSEDFKSRLPTDACRAIAFDGGGIRGIFQAQFLAELADLNLLKQSHLLAGTSTGAIIAICLALNKNPVEIAELYDSLGSQLFQNKKTLARQVALGHPAFSSKLLKELLLKHIPEKTFFGDCDKRVLVAATSLNAYTCHIFDSNSPQHKSLRAIDVVLASSAAPTYFSPHMIFNQVADAKTQGKPIGTIWGDGGLTCNNPAFECVTTLFKDGFDFKNIHVLSIANGRQPNTPDPTHFNNIGPVGWAKSLVPICMDVSSDQAHKKCLSMLPASNYLRVDPMLNQEIALDDYAKALNILPPLAKLVADDFRPQINKWLQ